MIRILISILSVCVLLSLQCVQVAGTASEVDGKYAIKGSVVTNSGEPANGAIVRIRPRGYLALNKGQYIAFDTVTDRSGCFYFDTVPVDSYTIEVNLQGEYGVLQLLQISSFDSFPVVLPTAVLTPTGSISGLINLPISDDTSRPWVALYNVDYLAKTPFTQEFRFNGIPQGSYNLRIVPYFDSKLVVELRDVIVKADSTTDVGILNFTIQQFFKGCTSFECDSIAIQSILDINGLSGVSVHAITAVDSVTGRVTKLDLSNRSIKNLPKDIGSLSSLRILDLRKNRIANLPEQFGYLKAMRYCYLDSNELCDLPMEMSYLCSLEVLTVSHNHLYRIDSRLINMAIKKLDLRFNRLESLPDESRLFTAMQFLYLDNNYLSSLPKALFGARLQEFTISNNRLCSITSASLKWLDTFDEDWKVSQHCTVDTTFE